MAVMTHTAHRAPPEIKKTVSAISDFFFNSSGAKYLTLNIYIFGTILKIDNERYKIKNSRLAEITHFGGLGCYWFCSILKVPLYFGNFGKCLFCCYIFFVFIN